MEGQRPSVAITIRNRMRNGSHSSMTRPYREELPPEGERAAEGSKGTKGATRIRIQAGMESAAAREGSACQDPQVGIHRSGSAGRDPHVRIRRSGSTCRDPHDRIRRPGSAGRVEARDG
jgi:hypothetical protein